MLGALIGLTSIVKPESVTKVLESRIPAELLDFNIQALQLGLKLADGLSPQHIRGAGRSRNDIK
jgi:Pyruvate/2-oxoacid:ferredoxin oxidoreductase gamma subunit